MNKILTGLLALALFTPALALAQNDQQQNSDAQRAQQNQAAENQVNGSNTSPHQMMTGMVSDNGNSFTSNNTKYQVSNPDALKNYNNQTVTVKYQFNTESNSIKINKVNPQQ